MGIQKNIFLISPRKHILSELEALHCGKEVLLMSTHVFFFFFFFFF